ncbi:hypothetical protein BDR06DRAFT_965480 [Suillus hirtellus]|nr:hypothetical protein BDR06DRAFT_965480 [Suillus hirtellus]
MEIHLDVTVYWWSYPAPVRASSGRLPLQVSWRNKLLQIETWMASSASVTARSIRTSYVDAGGV